jgi:purine catabolism regulator
MGFPHLRLTLLGGGKGLHRSVAWAHASDLMDPWQWPRGW